MADQAKVLPQPLDFRSVAYIAFDVDRPVIMSTAEIPILADTLFDVAVRDGRSDYSDDSDSGFSIFDDGTVDREGFLSAMRRFTWRLYLINDAKQVWSAYHDLLTKPANQPSLFKEEPC